MTFHQLAPPRCQRTRKLSLLPSFVRIFLTCPHILLCSPRASQTHFSSFSLPLSLCARWKTAKLSLDGGGRKKVCSRRRRNIFPFLELCSLLCQGHTRQNPLRIPCLKIHLELENIMPVSHYSGSPEDPLPEDPTGVREHNAGVTL